MFILNLYSFQLTYIKLYIYNDNNNTDDDDHDSIMIIIIIYCDPKHFIVLKLQIILYYFHYTIYCRYFIHYNTALVVHVQ